MTIVLNGTSGAQIPLGTAAAPSATNTTAQATGLYFPTSTTLGLSTNGTAALTIDASQNVGIGTTSPGYTLDVNGQIRIQNGKFLRMTTSGTTNLGYLGPYNSIIGSGSLSDILLYNAASGGIYFSTSGGSALLDSSGNVGIGTSSSGAKLEVNGSIKLTPTLNGGLQINQSGGTINSFIGPSGFGGFAMGTQTADNVILFSNNSERMRIDSSGNLLVGTTSASGRITSNSTTSSAPQLSFQGSPQYTIANGSNTVVFSFSDIALVGVRDSNNTGQAAFFAMTGSAVSLIWQSGSLWSVTTTPSAGNFGFAYNGSNYAIYNNRGSSVNFQVGVVKFA